MTVDKWDQRQLCPDGGCVGVIGMDGKCKVCGTAAPDWGDPRKPGRVSSKAEEDELDDSADPVESTEAKPTSEDRAKKTWTSRQLCADGSCIGVIGPDGNCKVCGKPAGLGSAEADEDDDGDDDEDDAEYDDDESADAEAEDDHDEIDDGGDGDDEDEDEDDGVDETDSDDDEEDEEDEEDEDEDDEADDGDANRTLCSDGACVGVIGADGKCKVCGKAAA